MDPDDGEDRSADGGAGLDEAAVYRAVRRAVEDAILDVVGTLLLLGIAFVLVVGGAQALLTTETPLAAALGGGALVVGVYVAAATLELIPPIREWR